MKQTIKYLCFVFLCLLVTFGKHTEASAAVRDITVADDDQIKVEVCVGDTGRIVVTGDSSRIVGYEYLTSAMDDSELITMEANGTFTVKAKGEENIFVYGHDENEEDIFYAKITLIIHPDMSGVTLKKSSITAYLPRSYQDTKNTYYKRADINIPVNSTELLDEYERHTSFQYTSSLDGTDDVWVSAELRNNTIELSIEATKSCKMEITFTIEGKTFVIPVKAKVVDLSSYGCLLEKGHTKKLRVKGCSEKIVWKSFDSKIASVSKNGVVKGKKIGNVLISAKLGDQYVGCVVSVTTAQIKKVCVRASYMGKNWKYSQAKRGQTGYYDCSSLVWKAYKPYTKVNFGSAAYPGTTKTESAWCRDHGKLLKGGFSWKKLKQMKFNPGDIVFKSEDSSHPYATTYHVEMLTGYVCYRFDKNGEPWIEPLWATRDSDYGAEEGSLMARPTK